MSASGGTLGFGRFTVDAGRFVTPAGFEVYEAKDNWLYSHGLLFNFALPIAHQGVRVSTALTPDLTGYAFLANGSITYTPNANYNGPDSFSYKAKDGMTVAGNLFLSKDPNPAPTPGNDALLLDVVFTKAMGATSFAVSADLGSYDGSSFFGVGGAVKHALAADGLKVVGRVEFFSDKDGVHYVLKPGGWQFPNPDGSFSTPTLLSLTGGVNYPVGSNAELRAELRYDNASEKVYGNDPSNGLLTFTASAIAWF